MGVCLCSRTAGRTRHTCQVSYSTILTVDCPGWVVMEPVFDVVVPVGVTVDRSRVGELITAALAPKEEQCALEGCCAVHAADDFAFRRKPTWWWLRCKAAACKLSMKVDLASKPSK